MKASIQRIIQFASLALIGLVSIFAVGIMVGESPVHAYPEFATRTNEPCSTCHVNPGGGGPRTLRGLLWSAQGRPDEVPILDNILIAPGVTDAVELFDVACTSCHGASGEGLFGLALTSSGITENKIRTAILRGRERSGMPSFEGQLTDEQIEILIRYVAGIASGEFEPAPLSYELEVGRLECIPTDGNEPCGGN